MLTGYISGLKAYRERSIFVGKREGTKRPRFDGWDEVLISVDGALETFRKAESHRKEGDFDAADVTVLEGMRLLRERYYFL